jgi:acetylglutamate/LysW-gamma-L-alpha-aminoadipate kinase
MILLKIGGGASINLKGICADLADVGEDVIIVHGANAMRDELLTRLGMEKQVITSLSGHTSVFTDEALLDVQIMAYAGLMNKRIVELCQQNGLNAVGLSGLDGRVIEGRRNQGIKVKEGSRIRIVRDRSGKPVGINTGLLKLLLANHYTPVLTIPIIDEQKFGINSENDDIVALLQKSMDIPTVIQLIVAPGILRDPEDPKSLIATMTRSELQELERKFSGRIKRKLYALGKLLEGGETTVIVSDGRLDAPVKHALAGGGTVIR